MAPPQDRSCHVLQLSVDPGGSRWAELHAYPELDKIRACLDVFLGNSDGFSAYHAIRYGATLGIWTVQRGDVAGFVDLHPFIRVRLGDAPPVPLVDDDATSALVYERRRQFYLAEAEARDEEEEDEDDDEDEEDDIPGPDEWDDYDLTTYEQMTLEIDWDAVAARLPALHEPLLAPRERGTLRYPASDRPRFVYARPECIRYGSYDVENGGPVWTPFPVPAIDDDDDDDDDDA